MEKFYKNKFLLPMKKTEYAMNPYAHWDKMTNKEKKSYNIRFALSLLMKKLNRSLNFK